MCLGVPGKIIEIYNRPRPAHGQGRFWRRGARSLSRNAAEAKVGDYTIVHAGFALNLLSEEEAQKRSTCCARCQRSRMRSVLRKKSPLRMH